MPRLTGQPVAGREGGLTMPQHLWSGSSEARACEVCLAHQIKSAGDWAPPISSICPGDPDDGGRRITRRRPDAPSGAPRMLEPA